MTDGLDQDADEGEDIELPVMPDQTQALFGEFCVLSPGVEIVLEGRPVSAPAAD